MEETFNHPWLAATAVKIRAEVEAKQAKSNAVEDARAGIGQGEQNQTTLAEKEPKGIAASFSFALLLLIFASFMLSHPAFCS